MKKTLVCKCLICGKNGIKMLHMHLKYSHKGLRIKDYVSMFEKGGTDVEVSMPRYAFTPKEEKIKKGIRKINSGCFKKGMVSPNKGKFVVPREIRVCACGHCNQDFECKVTSKKKYVKGHGPKWDKGLTLETSKEITQKAERYKEKYAKGEVPPVWNKGIKGIMIPWNKGLNKEIDSRLIETQEHKEKTSKALKKYYIEHPKSEESKRKSKEARLKQILPRKDTKIEVAMQNILTQNGIIFTKHKPLLGQPDIFIEPNICIFCDGDYWHANPLFYKENDIMMNNKMARQVWDKDRKITETLESQGKIVLRFWESEINGSIDSCIEKIKEAIQYQLH